MKLLKLIPTIFKNLFLIIIHELKKLWNRSQFCKFAIFFILLAAIAGGGFLFFKKVADKISKPQPVTVRADAETIARKFMSKRSDRDQYEEESISAETYPEFWNVWFATKDKNARPNRGLVQVNRETRVAQWKELQ